MSDDEADRSWKRRDRDDADSNSPKRRRTGSENSAATAATSFQEERKESPDGGSAKGSYVHVSGLPWRVSKQEIIGIFEGIEVSRSATFLLYNHAGDAYVKLQE